MKPWNYTQEKVEEALEQIKARHMSIHGAARHYGIPYTTLGDKIRGRRPIKAKPRTVLSPEEEKMLIEWLINSPDHGLWHTRSQLKDKVKEYLDAKGGKTCFRGNRPGKVWVNAFLKRNSEVSGKIVRGVRSDIIPAAKDSLTTWFDEMKENLDAEDPALLISPERIFTLSEFVFNVCAKTEKILGILEPKNLWHAKRSIGKHVTVWACFSASGQSIPPISIFWNSEQDGSQSQRQSSGRNRVTEQVLLNFVKDSLVPRITSQTPVVLFTDGLSSCDAEAVNEMCGVNRLFLHNLKAKENYLIQALYQPFFHSFKFAWRKVVKDFGGTVKMDQFSAALKRAWDSACSKPEIIVKSFELTGIFPYNPSAVLDSERLKPSYHFQHVLSNSSIPQLVKVEPDDSEILSASQLSNSSFDFVPCAIKYQRSAINFVTNSSPTPTVIPNLEIINGLDPEYSPEGDNSSTPSPMSRLFELMKFNFCLGQKKATKFMEVYEKNCFIVDDIDTSYKNWKLLMDNILAQMNINFNLGEKKATAFMRRYEGDGEILNDPQYMEWKNVMDSIMSGCQPTSSYNVPRQEPTSVDDLPIVITVGQNIEVKPSANSFVSASLAADHSQLAENGGSKRKRNVKTKTVRKRKQRKS